jgi:hypothetical protein
MINGLLKDGRRIGGISKIRGSSIKEAYANESEEEKKRKPKNQQI